MTVAALSGVLGALQAELDDERLAQLCLPFDDEERKTWYYLPWPRRGLALGRLTPEQRRLTFEALATVISLGALAQTTAIVGLDDVLAELERSGQERVGGDLSIPRDPTLYFATLFGQPGDARWAFRFEGHHVSIHITIVGEAIVATPFFLGASPAAVWHGSRAVLRPLAVEEELGRALLRSLSATERRRAVLDDIAPRDIVSGNSPTLGGGLIAGVPIADLVGESREVALELIALYRGRTRQQPAVDLSDVHFAWAGGHDPGAPHYYRLAGTRFVAEYDNTQDGANHAHSVWRDPASDFGADLLRTHHHHHDHG